MCTSEPLPYVLSFVIYKIPVELVVHFKTQRVDSLFENQKILSPGEFILATSSQFALNLVNIWEKK